MIEDLLICSADPTIKEGRGQTPLHYATMHNKTEGVVEMLVKYGAPVNLQDIHHNSPLHLAAMFGNLVAVSLASLVFCHLSCDILHILCFLLSLAFCVIREAV